MIEQLVQKHHAFSSGLSVHPTRARPLRCHAFHATMSNQVSATTAEEMVEILSLLEEGYGAQLHNGMASPGSTPRSDAASPVRPAETMQKLRDIARGMHSSCSCLLGFRKADRASEQSSSAIDGVFLRLNSDCDELNENGAHAHTAELSI